MQQAKEAFIVVSDRAEDLPVMLVEATEACIELGLRMHDLIVLPLPSQDENSHRNS